MLTYGLSEIQKNISILSNLKEPVKIIDKRRKVVVAVVYPAQNRQNVEQLAGKYKNRIDPSLKDISIKEAKKQALDLVMKEKYDIPD